MTSQANEYTGGRPAYLDFSGPLAEALSDAVDPDFYEYVYGKLAPGTTAASHYATVGWREGRDPNPWFCTRAYVEAHPEIAESGIVPLFHFLQYGAAVRPAGTPCEHAEAYYRRPAAGDTGAGPEFVPPGSSLADQWQVVRDAFDSEYYLAENPGVERAGIDPVLHFLQQGWTEGRDPNAWFSVSAYLDAYPDVAQTQLNPFYHFLASGRAQGREAKLGRDKFDANYYVETNPDVARMAVNPLSHFVARGWREGRAPNAWARADFLQDDVASKRRAVGDGSNYESVLCALGKTGAVSIVVVVDDNLDEVRAGVESLWRNTTYPAELLLIDDASADLEAARLLACWKNVSNVRVIRNATKRGQAQSIERGICESRGDVVLLTGGTAVGPRWLENLVLAANQRPSIATVTTLTNGAGAFAVVSSDRSGAAIERDAAARLVAQRSRRCLAPTPIGNGLCTLVKREALDRVGFLDGASAMVARSGVDDFYARASAAGWEHVVDDATVVFGSDALRATEFREPELQAQVQRFLEGPRLKAIRQALIDDMPSGPAREGASNVAPRVLYVVHGWGLGGTVEFCLDLIRGIGNAIEAYVLSSSGDRLTLYGVEGGELNLLDSRDLLERAMVTDVRNPDYRRAVYDLLSAYRFELVHVHQLIGHTLDIVDVARLMHVPVVLTCHDYYLACPNHLLLDDDFVFCDGICTPGAGTCRHDSPWLLDAPPLKHQWVHEWRKRVTPALRSVDAVTMPSQDARLRHLRLLPVLQERPVFTIEHGLDIPSGSAARAPSDGEKIRILFPGYLGRHKGTAAIEALHDADIEGRLEFHFLGKMPRSANHYGIGHGEYRRHDFVERVTEIAPAFIGIFSIWAESFCYVLSEAWLAGVPVIGTNLGAVGERIRREGGGWTFDVRDVEKLYRGILAIADNPAEYRRGIAAAQAATVRSIYDMQADYFALYRRVGRNRSAFRSPTQSLRLPV